MPNIKNQNQKINLLKQVLKKGKLNKNEFIRVQAVLLNLQGYKHKEITQITQKSVDALKKWITAFNKYGIDGLRNKMVIKPSNYKLTKEQKDKIKDIITKHSPQKYSLKGEFWNPYNLKQLIKKQFNVIYKSRTSYTDLLKYCGFSYQKVEFKDTRENQKYKRHEKLRLEKKLKKGVLRMYW